MLEEIEGQKDRGAEHVEIYACTELTRLIKVPLGQSVGLRLEAHQRKLSSEK